MPPRSAVHELIAASILGALQVALRETPCRPIGSDLHLGISPNGLFTYPDAMIVCDQLQLLHFDTVTNPAVIFEVAFPGTPPSDPGEKYRHYRTILGLSPRLTQTVKTQFAVRWKFLARQDDCTA
jgi:Uma2 family endonuclease